MNFFIESYNYMLQPNQIKCLFGKYYFCQLILLFNLFLLLFMSLIAFLGTIHGLYCIISANFYFQLLYFQ